MGKKIEKHTFYKGKVYHLDQFYNIQAFVMPHAEPYKQKYDSQKWDSDMSENHKMLKTVRIKIEVTTF